MDGDALNLANAQTANSAQVWSSSVVMLMVGGAIVVLGILIVVSVRLALRLGAEESIPAKRLRHLSAPAKLLCFMVFVSLLVAQAVAAGAVFMHTQVINESTWHYFQRLSEARLLGTSHSHIFGFAVMYGVIGLMLTMTGARMRTKCFLIAAIMWGGLFDVLSWWGMKAISPQFEWLTIVTGTTTGIGSLVAFVLVARELFATPENQQPAPSTSDGSDPAN